MIRVLVLMVFVGLACTGCSKKYEDLKSPCVGADDSPCGPKRNVNDWWAKA